VLGSLIVATFVFLTYLSSEYKKKNSVENDDLYHLGKQRCTVAPHNFTNVFFVYCDAMA
jgi:hypothetical protein